MDEEEVLGTARIPGNVGTIILLKRGDEFILRVHDTELMTSAAHLSEDSLSHLVCGRLKHLEAPTLLIGGLGMGFTLAAALASTGPQAKVVVAELIGAVVEWNRGPLGHLAGFPLKDPRVSLRAGDVAMVLQTELEEYDGILLDVDNGPEGLTRDSNDWLYSNEGLAAAYSALRPGGILAVWSSHRERSFAMRLAKIGFAAEEVRVPGDPTNPDERHSIWVAKKP
ncbi:hypothetical protein EPO15_16110 [bacterium]|nr:MAG: hypothetical protein EPO15_16110 [bacterium]